MKKKFQFINVKKQALSKTLLKSLLSCLINVFIPLPVCASSGDVGGVRVTKDMAGSRWEAGTWWPPE